MDREHIRGIAQDVWSVEANSISNLKNVIDFNALESVIEILCECKQNKGRVVTVGVGTSGVAARKVAHTLSCIEIPSFFLSAADGVHGALGALQKGDVVVAISKGGGTEEILKILPAVSTKGAKLIGVTEKDDSPLAKASDVTFKVTVEREPDPFNMLATASTMAVIAAFDAVAIALMQYTGYRKEQFAVIHPGGAVGERLIKGKK